ncbi:MAG: hypothetical protein ABJC19_05295 [Gemmatimonadota bacterium]
MLSELHRKPASRRSVEAGKKPFDDATRHHLEAAESRDVGRLQQVGAGGSLA